MEINIKAKVTEEGKIATIIQKRGFKTEIEGILQFIGLLENMKAQQLDKLKNLSKTVSKNGMEQ